MNTLNKEYLLEFLKRQRIAILSTVNDKGLPDAAPIFFIHDNDGNIFFITTTESQKYVNMKNKPHVVLTITNEEKKETLQIRGKVSEDEKRLSEILSKFTQKLDVEKNFTGVLPVLSYKNQQKTVIKIKPYQIRMRQYSDNGFEEKNIEFSQES